MNRVVVIPDDALLRLACKSETGDQTMYDVDTGRRTGLPDRDAQRRTTKDFLLRR